MKSKVYKIFSLVFVLSALIGPVNFAQAQYSQPILILSTSFASFNYTQGGTVPQAMSANISNNSTSQNITYSIYVPNQPAWLNTAYNTNTLTLGPLQSGGVGISVDPTKVGVGSYSTKIYFSGNFSNSPASIDVSLNVTAGASGYPIIALPPPISGVFSLSKLSFNFYATQGDTANQYDTLEFTYMGSSPLNYYLSVDNQPKWLTTGYNTNPLPAYTNTPTGLGAGIDPSGLSVGQYNTSIKISGSFPGSPIVIPVSLTISAKTPGPTNGPAHANYTNVVGPDGTVYRIEYGARYPYTSAGAFLSYGFNTWSTVLPATTGDLALDLPTYTPSGSTQSRTYFIPPRNGSLINDNGTVYLITNGLRTGFASSQAFLGLGYSFVNAQPGDTSFMVTLAPINSSAMAHPDGTLINDNGTIYLLKNNYRMGFPSMAVFYSWGLKLNEVVPANSYDRSAPVSGILNLRLDNQLSI
jgi:hypothetical protein